MIVAPTLAAEDSEVEISALVRTLHETQQRLQELAGYEVDAVIHPGGHPYLLHEAQEKLRRSEERFTGAFEYAPIGVALVSPDGRWLKVNRALCDLVGYSEADLLTLNYQSITHPDDLTADLEKIRETLAGETVSYQLEKRYVHAHGHFVTVSLHVSLVRDGAGEPSYFIVQIQDITARKESENEVRFNEQRYRSLVEAITEIVWDTPASGDFEVEQPGWSAFTGQTFAELRGSGWLQAIHPDDREETARVWSAAVSSRSTYQVEHRLRAHDGSYHNMTVRGVPILADDGTIVQWIGIHTDITERKKLEQQFLRAQRMESIGTLAGGIAHDLNNVLTPIMMSIELLKMREQNPLRLEILTTIEGSAKRGADMVLQVLSFARGVEGQQLEVQVGHLIKEIKKIVQDTFLKNIEVRGKVPSDLWLLRGDPTQLHQVLLNLCVNARDAMPSGGTLTLTASNIMLDEQYAGMNIDAEPGPHVCIEVEDSGTGMPPDVLERIFEPFFTTKEFDKGTGLGLSTSIAIIKSHGGFVRVYSEVGMGSRFHVYLPAHTGPGAAENHAAPVEFPRGKGELVLVAEDEPAVRQIIRQTLEAFGYRVVLASDGVEATSIYATRKEEIAIVLTDIMMPLMDGPTTIQVLLRLNPQVRIIAASGLNANAMVAKATSAGIKHFLPKPYTAETLLKTLRDVLEA